MATAQVTAMALKRRTRRRTAPLPILIAMAVVGVGGWTWWSKTHPHEDPNASLLTAPVTRGDLVESVSATGSVTAQTGAQVKIGSQITGTIKHLYADVGTYVKANQVIAELDLPDLQAQLAQSQASLAAARTRLEQQQSGVGMQRNQSSGAVTQAEAEVRSAQARLDSSLAAARLQGAQTPTDIQRAQNAVGVAQASLSTAKSNLNQVQASANLQVATSQEQLNQALANAKNSSVNLERQQKLLDKGFVAASTVDTATAQNDVFQSQVNSARQNILLTKEKIAADLQSAKDGVAQAEQNLAASKSALTAAKAGTYQDASKQADVQSARALLNQSKSTLVVARGNTTQDVLKTQDVQQAKEAVNVAQAQVDYYRAQLAKTLIRSPISGTVLQLASQQGETLAAGLSAPTLIIVADLKRLQVDVYVDETDIGKIKVGQDASVTVDAFPKRPFLGKVMKVASGSTIQQGVITYDVTVAIGDKQHQLKPDMTASVTIQTGKRTGVLLVPSESVKVGSHGSTVNVLTKKDNKNNIDTRRVKTGGSDGVNTEVREGVKEGEIIVRAGIDAGKKPGGGPSSPFGGGGGRGR